MQTLKDSNYENNCKLFRTSTEDQHWPSVHQRMLASKGFAIKPDARVLDFGCGEGQLVYEYRTAGFDAYGFDIFPSAKVKQRSDEQFFLYSLTGSPLGTPDYAIDPAIYRIPCDDEFFDFIFSVSTFEHLQNHDLALRELARVLKPGGVSIHIFPARYMRIEHHILVPFGGFIQNYYWYLVWALLGVRNSYQRNLRAAECAANNLLYAKNCLNYMRLHSLLGLARKHFSHVEVDPRLWELRVPGRSSFWAALLHTPAINKPASWWYNRCCTLVLFLGKQIAGKLISETFLVNPL